MACSLILLFNHTLTPVQEADARHSLGVTRFVQPPEDIQYHWANLPPALESLAICLEPVKAWVKQVADPKDFILIQGDFGATCFMVRESLEMGLIPIYSSTERQAVEELQPDGSIKLIHHFRHVRFRRYGV